MEKPFSGLPSAIPEVAKKPKLGLSKSPIAGSKGIDFKKGAHGSKMKKNKAAPMLGAYKKVT
jgi:hypothetical protein